MRNYLSAICISGAIITLGSCHRGPGTDVLHDAQCRFVSVSKQYNEIIWALGLQEHIVAIDQTSAYPPELSKITKVGYHRALSAEAILSVHPSLILHDNNIGPPATLSQLDKMKVPMKSFGHYSETIAGTDSLIHEIAYFMSAGNPCGHKEQLQHALKSADSICMRMKQAFGEAQQKTAALKRNYKLRNTASRDSAPRVLIIHYGQASNQFLVMTRNSIAAKMIGWAGGTLAVEGDKSMKQLSPEVIAASDPDVIIITEFGYNKLNQNNSFNQLPGLQFTRAFRNGRIIKFEEHKLVYLGPRTGDNILALQQIIFAQ